MSRKLGEPEFRTGRKVAPDFDSRVGGIETTVNNREQ